MVLIASLRGLAAEVSYRDLLAFVEIPEPSTFSEPRASLSLIRFKFLAKQQGRVSRRAD